MYNYPSATVDGAGDAVDHLHVELREREGRVAAGIAHITLRRSVDNVAHLKALDGLVLGHTVGAFAAKVSMI